MLRCLPHTALRAYSTAYAGSLDRLCG
jgi:hypothetical protein